MYSVHKYTTNINGGGGGGGGGGNGVCMMSPARKNRYIVTNKPHSLHYCKLILQVLQVMINNFFCPLGNLKCLK